MDAYHGLQPSAGVASACATLGINRAGIYRQRAQPRHTMPPKPRARPALALCATERQVIIEILDSERFVDVAPDFQVRPAQEPRATLIVAVEPLAIDEECNALLVGERLDRGGALLFLESFDHAVQF